MIVGISRYAHAEPLQYAASDAQAFRDFVSSPRGGGIPADRVISLLEDQATRRSLEIEFESMQERVKGGDTVYIFMAGHGYLTSRGIGYFIPIDGDMRVPASTSISFSALKELIELGLSNAGRRILFTDLCHAGRIGPEKTELAEKIQNLINAELLKVTQGVRGSYLNLLSSSPLESSWESDQLKKGVFSYMLMEALNGKAAPPGSPVVRAQELVAYLRAEVPKFTKGKQTPMVNSDFDPKLPLSFLDQAGPSAPAPSPTSTQTTQQSTLTFINADQAAYVRVQWNDPQTKAVAVRLIQWSSSSFEIDSLVPGEMEMSLVDTDNRSHKLAIKLKPGSNTLDLVTGKTVDSGPRPLERIQLASLSLSLPSRDRFASYRNPAMAEAGDASLLMRLDSGTQVYLDGSHFGNSPGAGRFLLMQRLTPGNHNLTLIASPEREQRFRVKLFSGRQIFDTQSGELRAVMEVQPPPDFLTFPSNLPPASENAYRGFRQALWEEKLIEPAGMSAWDYFQQLRDGVPSELRDSLKNRLAVSMGDRAQRTILKYLRGGDIKWNAAAFDEGAALAGHAQRLHRATTSLQSQERFFQGRALIEKGQYSQAVQQLQEAVKLDPAASHAYNALGLALWKQNLLMQAIAPLQQAIALSPAWTYPRNTLGLIYLEQRLYQEAAQSFQSSIELNDEDSMAFHCLGQLHLLLGRWQEAETQLQRALEVTPGNAYAYATLGRLYQQLQQWSKAEQMFRLALRLEPEEPSFHLGLAELLQRAGRPEEAQSVFVRMMKQYPASPLVLQAYAAFLAAQKNSVEGERLYRQAVQLAPNDPNAHVRLGLFLQQQARPNDAAVEFKAAIQIAPDNPYAHHNLAVTYLAQKRIPEAEKELAAAVNADRRYPAPPFLLGQIRFAQKRYQEALREYSSALGLSIEVHQQQEIKEKIQEAESALVAEKIEEAKGRMERKEYVASWSIFAELLKTTQGERRLRDAILQFQDEHFAAADLSALPPCKLSEILKTSFWKEQIQAEQLWRQGQKDQALRAILAAIGALKREERPSLLSVYFNLGNERFGIHRKVCLWALRFIEGRDYSGAMRLLDEANRQNIFGVVPGISPLTIDSLMIPPENPEPKQFSDFDVAHHPDRGVHEAYAAAHAGMGNLGEVRKYLMALETAKPNLPARMAVARVFQQEQKWDSAIALLKESLTSADITSYKELLPEAFILLADIQCQAGGCAAGRDTLEAGLKLSPESKAIKEAMQRMKSPSRRNQ